MNYRPDGWFLIQVTAPTEKYYRIFASWSGGYLDGDSWRMNSGITKCEYEDGIYKFYGNSGSIYSCHENNYGSVTAYNGNVLQNYIENSNGMVQAIPFLPDNLTNYDW